ncbi:hypothetical protein U9M48_008659 [Paspalum notatum var. saurae]|uniref:Mitochondrial protein n=1 Tax=Paspalum notatum var. saurae TaxID=547442 RepID=A0AAQ3SPE6_PASNO
MIGSLRTRRRPGRTFGSRYRLCARYQASPRTSYRQAVKRIFRYLKFTPELGLWYSSGSSLSLRGFSMPIMPGCRIDRKSTSRHMPTLRNLSCLLLLWMKATLSDFGLKYGRIPLLVDSTSAKKFRGMIGSLLYLTATRTDIQFAVCLCARYQASPRTSYRQAVKRIFRYLKFTPELGFWYSSGSSLSLRGFSDADHAGCRIDRKSTSGTCQLLGTSLVSWSSRKQASVALSTTEAEYVATAS